MAFTEKVLSFAFSGAPGFSGAPTGSFTAQGLRAVAGIQRAAGRLGVQAQVKVWGLSMAQMNAYSSVLSASIGGAGLGNFSLVISAGDLGDQLTEVMEGLIWNSFIDLGDAPDSSFNITVAPLFAAADPIAAQSQPGSQDVKTLIASLCAAGGLTLNPSSVKGRLRNQSTYGSVIDQVERVARAAGLSWKLEGSKLSIWARGGTVDDVVIAVGPDTEPRMVGYPQYWEQGIIVTSLFNPEIQVGRQMAVTSTIPKANGVWSIINVQDNLATMMDRGPWFTTAVLSGVGV
jgi:hypothetical protein